MNARLTKTQIELLKRHRNGIIYTQTGYQYGKGYGFRQSKAAGALRDAGLLEFHSSELHRNVVRGHTRGHGHSSVWRLTQVGIDLLKNLL